MRAPEHLHTSVARLRTRSSPDAVIMVPLPSQRARLVTAPDLASAGEHGPA
jgi:hypothetical protein